jgi:plastocyanin
MVCLAIPATLVSAQAPAPEAVPDPGQAVTPEEPAEAPAPQPPASELPPSTETPEPDTTAPPVPTEPEEPAPPPPVADSPTTASAKTASVAILDGNSQSDYVFSPASLTIAAGDTVTWTNNGNQPHDVTGDGLSSGTLQSGQGYSHTFASAGNFSYICSIHPFMKGSVTVQASAGVTDPEAAPSATAPSSESSAVASPDAAGNAAQLPSTGMPVWPLLAAGGGLVLAGALLRRRASLS